MVLSHRNYWVGMWVVVDAYGITVAGLDHKTGYKPIGMTCTVGTLFTTVVAIILSTILYG